MIELSKICFYGLFHIAPLQFIHFILVAPFPFLNQIQNVLNQDTMLL